jgi:hypothetical protein
MAGLGQCEQVKMLTPPSLALAWRPVHHDRGAQAPRAEHSKGMINALQAMLDDLLWRQISIGLSGL